MEELQLPAAGYCVLLYFTLRVRCMLQLRSMLRCVVVACCMLESINAFAMGLYGFRFAMGLAMGLAMSLFGQKKT